MSYSIQRDWAERAERSMVRLAEVADLASAFLDAHPERRSVSTAELLADAAAQPERIEQRREQRLPQAEEARLYAEIALASRQADLAAERRERAEQSTLGYWRGLLAHQGAPAQERWIPPGRTMGEALGISDGTKTSPTPERVLMMRRAAYAGGVR